MSAPVRNVAVPLGAHRALAIFSGQTGRGMGEIAGKAIERYIALEESRGRRAPAATVGSTTNEQFNELNKLKGI